jgi:hypothetical protein
MATIKANGGAASVWERHTGLRVVLCRNGRVLTGIGPSAYAKPELQAAAG